MEIEVESDSNIYCTDEMNADYLETLNASEYLGTTQTECSPGTYQPSSGQDSCLDADPGYYVDGYGSTTQAGALLAHTTKLWPGLMPRCGSWLLRRMMKARRRRLLVGWDLSAELWAGRVLGRNLATTWLDGSASQTPAQRDLPARLQSSCLDASGPLRGSRGSATRPLALLGRGRMSGQDSCPDASGPTRTLTDLQARPLHQRDIQP